MMNNEKLLSVIVANYNNESYLRECLDSILSQEYKNLEIVICDDCSTDSSVNIIREYEQSNPSQVRSIFNSCNKGVAATRHEAILYAKGEYITTLDSDDYYADPEKLKEEMEVVEFFEKKNRDIIAFSNIVLVKEDKNEKVVWGTPETISEGYIFYPVITRSCMIPRDFTMNKSLYFEVGGYDTRFPIYEDWDLKIRLAQRYEFHFTGINGTAYRRHGKGLSSPPIPVHIEWLKLIFNKNIGLEQNQTKQEELTARFNEFIASLEASHK